jgi:hypothetical protein
MYNLRSGLILLIAVLMLAPPLEAQKRLPRTCKGYATHQAAQKVYRSDPIFFWNLDRDRDGIACECNLGGPKVGSSACRRRK